MLEVERYISEGYGIDLKVPVIKNKKIKTKKKKLDNKLPFNEKEIKDHKKYYNYKDLEKLFKKTNRLKIEKHKYFQFYMNNFCTVKKEIGKVL